MINNDLSFDEMLSQSYILIKENKLIESQVIMEKILQIDPHHILTLTNLALVKRNLNKPEESYEHLLTALKYSNNKSNITNIYDALVCVCRELNHFEEAIYYARLSIQAKKNMMHKEEIIPIPSTFPPGISSDIRKNIISYSLFGQEPRYCEVAILNVMIAKQIYPQWTCRFYVDDTVPAITLSRLSELGAEIIHVDERLKKISGLFWRFMVIDDANVQCFLIRDVDSLLSYKEKSAVDEWIQSGQWFHIMRDNIEHAELILAGMWGGYTGIFKNIFQYIRNKLKEIPDHNSTIDQVFLRYYIFPTVCQSVLTHDSYYLEENTKPFPHYPISDIERIPHFHIGMIDAGALDIHLNIEDSNAKRVQWWLMNQQNQIICSYENNVPKSGNIHLRLPYFYTYHIKRGEYYILQKVIA